MATNKIGGSDRYGSGELATPENWSPGGQDFTVQRLNRTDREFDRERKQSGLHTELDMD